MLTREEFYKLCQKGTLLLDGATGSNLRKAGMPRGCCTEQWVLDHPEVLISLQKSYADAGCQVLYAPTFQAQPIALKQAGITESCRSINKKLLSLSREAAPDKLIAGDLTTLAAFTDSWDPNNFELLVENYRAQIEGLLEGGTDLLVAETLLYPQEAEAILTAAELEGAGAVMYSFTMQSDGSLFSGMDAGNILRELEQSGAAAVGFNCVAADMMTPYLVTKLRRSVKGPLLCKPNAGIPVIGEDQLPHYPMSPEEFTDIAKQCIEAGASVIGGCCGTTPDHMAAVKAVI